MLLNKIPYATNADRLLDQIENGIKNCSKELEDLKEQLPNVKGIFKRRQMQERIAYLEKYLRFAHVQEKRLSDYIFTNTGRNNLEPWRF